MIGLHETTLEQLTAEHTIEVNTLVGSARLSVPIRTSPGRESFGPALALGYGSGEGNSTFGVGWFLSGIPSIGIDTRRSLPTYQADSDSYEYGGVQELVPYRRKQGSEWIPIVDSRGGYRVERFRSKVERSYERFEKWTDPATGRAHWLTYTRNGVISVFGRASDNTTRVADPEDPNRRTFQWLLEAQFDPKGNAILYEYKPEDGAGVDPKLSFESRRIRTGGTFAQRYIKRILYGNSAPLSPMNPTDPTNKWLFEIVFDYGEHNAAGIPTPSDTPPAPAWTVREDSFSTYRPGFELRTYRLCRRILMFHHFPELGNSPCLVGATEFTHREGPAGTVLEAIQFHGYRRDLATGAMTQRTIPPLKMSYSTAQIASSFEVAEPTNNVPLGLDGILYRWVDLKNEGLPGILHRQNQSWYFKENLGNGCFGHLEVVDEIPASMSAAFQLCDFDNDGHMNLVGFEGREAGQYRRDREQGRWEGFQTLRNLPRVDFANARVQWVDLNGDDYVDLIVDHTDRLVWYASEGEDGFACPVEMAKPDISTGGAPTLTESRQLHTFFADMTGDGLLDMVRIDNGRVEYWPHLGHGKFGPGVVMENAPVIAGFDEIDAARIRFVDLDKSGAASIVYMGRGEVRYWVNQCGNRFGPERHIGNLPHIDNLSSAQVLDFLGDGSLCLVWSSSLPSQESQALQYIRLSGVLPPRMLMSVTNSAGRETRFSYRSSARDYLRDKKSDHPWRTRLPRHSMVVDSLEGIDHIGGTRMATCYEYRDGYFDSLERRFAGFGLVDAYDTDLHRATGATAPEEVTPPSLVRTWYHTGSDNGFVKRGADFYNADVSAIHLPAPVIEDIVGLTTEDQLDAYRALTGVQWRQEFYAMRPDGTRELHPLRTTEFGYHICCLQPIEKEGDGVFTFFQSESLSYEYEQDPSDPRVNHNVLVEMDTYGNVMKQVSLAYPRRPIGPAVCPEQRILHAELLHRIYTNLDAADHFEVGIESEERRFSLTGLSLGADSIISRETLLPQVTAALGSTLMFHDIPSGTAPQARLFGMRRNLFWDDSHTAFLPLGQVGAVSLLHHTEQAVLPEQAVDAAFDGRVTGTLLSSHGHYHRADGYWWAEDTTYRYQGAPAFYRLAEEINPGGSRQSFTFDAHALLVTAVEDIFGNRVEGTPDYQVLASVQVKDANDNVSEALYDPLGVAVVTGVRGDQLGTDGARHPVGADNLGTYTPQSGYTAADVLADPARFLQNASSFLCYDLEAFERGHGPPCSVFLEREQHVHDGEGTAPSPSCIRVTVSYVDGFGRPIQTKVRADAGPAVQRDSTGAVVVDGDGKPVLADAAERWLTSGHDVFNNKGWLVRKYEPLFSVSPTFESDEELCYYGVTTRAHYDPIGRIVRQDLPNGTFTSSAYSAWEIRQSDANDNVIGSAYEAARYPLPALDPEKDALTKAQAHAHTPTIVESDVLGRPLRHREIGAGGVERITTTIYGVMGLPERIIDPRNLTAFTYRYDMLGRVLFEHSMDAGDRWTLPDAHDRTVHQWNGRGVHIEYRYDQNGRPTETRVDGALGLNNLVERTIYGDNPVVSQAKLKNVRGRAVEHYDGAGILWFERYHMDGQVIDTRRSLCSGAAAYQTPVDWTDPATVPLDSVQHRSYHQFDSLGRVVTQSLPDGTTREYDYAALGHLTEVRVTTDDGQLNRCVIATHIDTNARGQLTRIRFGNGVETSYEYDPDTFRLERLYTRRMLGAVRDYLDVDYTYDPVGNITRWIDRVQDPGSATPLIQGLTTSSACEFTYDTFYQLKIATGRVHQALLEYDYRGGLSDPNTVKGTRHLSLNNGAAVERYTRQYSYDLGGNIESVRHQGTTQTWATRIWTSPTSNRSFPQRDLNGIDIVDPETRFDENGNTIRLPHLQAIDWNYANRMSRAVIIDRSAGGGPDDAEYYVYDADGQRVRRVTERLVAAGQVEVTDTIYFEGCEIRRIVRGGHTRLLRHTSHIADGSARLATLHQWSVDEAHRETDNIAEKKLHYLVGNHLGSVSLELDEAGDVISYEEYFPFGGTSFVAGSRIRDIKLKEYRYSSKCHDDATGFYCYEYRYYAPFIGNWLSPDPLGSVDGLNLYRFVHNNPVRYVDADGLCTEDMRAPTIPFGRLADAPEHIRQAFHTNTPEAQRIVENYVESSVVVRIGRSLYRLDVEVVPIMSGDQFQRWWANETSRTWVADVTAEYVFEEEDPIVGDPNADLPPEEEESLEEAHDNTRLERTGTQGDGGENRGGGGAEPTDGNSGTGVTQPGQTGESGSNGSGTTGQGPGAGQRGEGPGGGGRSATTGQGTQGTGTAAGAGAGMGIGQAERKPGQRKDGTDPGGGKPSGRPGGRPSGTGTQRSSKNETKGPPDMPPVPSGVPTGPNGIPYSPDMQLPEVIPEAGTPVTDPSQIRTGTGNNDPRSEPGSDKGTSGRPGGAEGGTSNGDTGDERARNAREESTLDTLTRWAGYANFVFDEPAEGGEAGGIPGGLGLLNLRGSAFQILYIGATVITTILMVSAIVKSVSLTALRQGFGRLVAAIRSPGAALRGLALSARAFWDETVQALGWLQRWVQRGRWGEFFRMGRWAGPGQSLRILFNDMRQWASIQQWRDHVSFLFRPRWFGRGPHYNWEHIFPQSLATNSPRLRGFVNSYLNSFLRLPARFNSQLGNRLGPKLRFYLGAFEAVRRSWRLGWSTGEQVHAEINATNGGPER